MVLLKDRASKKSASFDELNFNYLLAFRDARRCEISKTQVGQKTLKDRWGNRSKKRGKNHTRSSCAHFLKKAAPILDHRGRPQVGNFEILADVQDSKIPAMPPFSLVEHCKC